MAEFEAKKAEPETASAVPPPSPVTGTTAEEVPMATLSPPSPAAEENYFDSNALVVVEPVKEKPREGGSIDRDAVMANVATTKRESLIKAWGDNEGSKAENKAEKKLAAIGAWENSKRAGIQAELRQSEEKLEKQKAVRDEKLNNKIAGFHKTAEEKRAGVEAARGEDHLKAEEMAAKYQATGTLPKKRFSMF